MKALLPFAALVVFAIPGATPAAAQGPDACKTDIAAADVGGKTFKGDLVYPDGDHIPVTIRFSPHCQWDWTKGDRYRNGGTWRVDQAGFSGLMDGREQTFRGRLDKDTLTFEVIWNGEVRARLSAKRFAGGEELLGAMPPPASPAPVRGAPPPPPIALPATLPACGDAKGRLAGRSGALVTTFAEVDGFASEVTFRADCHAILREKGEMTEQLGRWSLEGGVLTLAINKNFASFKGPLTANAVEGEFRNIKGLTGHFSLSLTPR